MLGGRLLNLSTVMTAVSKQSYPRFRSAPGVGRRPAFRSGVRRKLDVGVMLAVPEKPGSHRFLFALVEAEVDDSGTARPVGGCTDLWADFFVGDSSETAHAQWLAPHSACMRGGIRQLHYNV